MLFSVRLFKVHRRLKFLSVMANYKCDICGNVYKYKRNLKGHVNEKHGDIERWNCVDVSCKSTFLRRTSLSKYLVLRHGCLQRITWGYSC